MSTFIFYFWEIEKEISNECDTSESIKKTYKKLWLCSIIFNPARFTPDTKSFAHFTFSSGNHQWYVGSVRKTQKQKVQRLKKYYINEW